MKHIKGIQARRLAARRPNWYHGLVSFNVKQHLKALFQVDVYVAACYIKIWTGMVMTGARRAFMGRGSAECRCREPSQTLREFARKFASDCEYDGLVHSGPHTFTRVVLGGVCPTTSTWSPLETALSLEVVEVGVGHIVLSGCLFWCSFCGPSCSFCSWCRCL